MSQPPGLHRNNRRTDSVASTCVNYCTCSYINLTNAPLHVICRRRHIDLVRHHINLVGLNTIYIYTYIIYIHFILDMLIYDIAMCMYVYM